MIRSMTGFARASAPDKEGSWSIEIRSINHRYFEFSLKIPPALSALENRIRDLVQAEMKRGKITLGLGLERSGKSRQVAIDESVVSLYLDSVKRLKKKFKLAGEISLDEVLRLPGVFSGEENQSDPEKSWPLIKKILKKALDQATAAKKEEGRKLAADISERLDHVTKSVIKIESLAKGRSAEVFKRLSARIEALLGEKEKDLERVEREVAFLAERNDITEEVVRMKSHLELFKNKLKGDSEVGRELDFLCQEMNREVNTMGSKGQLFEIATEVVFVKGELEKIREQIQNIE